MTAVDTGRQATTVVTTPQDRHRAAVHEAAHTVAAFRTGTRFVDVQLDPPLEPDCLGIMSYPKAPTFHALAVVLCAGLVVELQAGRSIEHGNQSCDLQEVLRLAADLTTETGRQPLDALTTAFAEAKRILRRQHAAVRRVTDALLVHGRLDYEQARCVAQLPGGVPGRAPMPVATGRG